MLLHAFHPTDHTHPRLASMVGAVIAEYQKLVKQQEGR